MSEDVPNEDLQNRVTYAILRPAARLALESNVSLREIKKLIELAYYQEARVRGFKMREISKLLSVSMAKVGLLSKALKDHFIEPELQHGISRQILSLLWAGALTESQIVNALPAFDKEEVSEALLQLQKGNRIRHIKGRTTRYELRAEAHRLDTHPWMAKIDGLNTLLEFVGRTVEARFFENDDRANVRNVAFRLRVEDLDKLKEFYETQLFPLIVELDDAVDEESESLPMKLSLLWTVDREDGEKNES